MKKLILMFLAILLILGLAACAAESNNVAGNTTDPTEQPGTTEGTEATEPAKEPIVLETPELKDNVYQISKPGHLLFLAENPTKNYALTADIDMDGYLWTPVDNFSGTLNGWIAEQYNYTIYNVNILATSADTDVGFFRVVSGTLKEVIFENISITCDGTFSGNMGAVVGRLDGKITEVEAKNCSINVTAKDANIGMICGKNALNINYGVSSGELVVSLAGGTCNIGGITGVAENIVQNLESKVNIDVSGSNTAGGVGGIIGNLQSAGKTLTYIGSLKVNTDASVFAGTMVGDVVSAGIATAFNCALNVEITGATTHNAYVGRLASDAVANDCWTRDVQPIINSAELAMREKVVDYMYRVCSIRWVPVVDMHFEDNSTTGHVQDYLTGVTYFGMPYTNQTGSLERFMRFLNEDGTVVDSIPATGWGGLMGNDCNDSVYWAWATVSGSISFLNTARTICQAGTIPVGGYNVTTLESTAQICTDNGAEAMYEAYACLKLGDAVLFAPGHIRMVAENAYVFRNPDGSINPDKSYIITHEQGAGTSKLTTRKSTCLTNYKYTFTSLLKNNYIPITIEAFANGKADELVISTTNTDPTKNGVAQGTVTANYRVNYLKLQVIDAQGNYVVDGYYSPDVRDIHVDSVDLTMFQQDVAQANLVAGKEYTYKVIYGYGDKEAVVQTFKFTA